MGDSPWPYGDDDVELTKEQIGYTSERVGGVWALTVLCVSDSGQPGGGRITSAWTPFEADSEEEVIRQARARWPGINVVPQHEWDKVFFRKWGGRPSSQLGGTGKRMAAERGSGRTPKSLPSQGAPGLSAAGLPPTWGTRTGSVSQRPQGSNNSRTPIDPAALKDFPLDEWIPVVRAAKRLGYPPQYLYNAVYHNKIKTRGERPKTVLWKDVLAKYRPDILKDLQPEERKENMDRQP